MALAQYAKMALAAGFLAASLVGSPISAHVQETASGTGKTLAALTLASPVEGEPQDGEALVDQSGTEVEDQQASTGDSEWKYVPVRRMTVKS